MVQIRKEMSCSHYHLTINFFVLFEVFATTVRFSQNDAILKEKLMLFKSLAVERVRARSVSLDMLRARSPSERTRVFRYPFYMTMTFQSAFFFAYLGRDYLSVRCF